LFDVFARPLAMTTSSRNEGEAYLETGGRVQKTSIVTCSFSKSRTFGVRNEDQQRCCLEKREASEFARWLKRTRRGVGGGPDAIPLRADITSLVAEAPAFTFHRCIF
jgi:hypothetical protein